MYHQIAQDGASSIFPPVTSSISNPQAFNRLYIIVTLPFTPCPTESTLSLTKMSLESHTQQLTQSLAQANLTPGLLPFLPPDFNPTTQLHVSFNDKPVSLGNLFRASECKTAPSVSFPKEVGRTLPIALSPAPCSLIGITGEQSTILDKLYPPPS